MNDKIDNTPNAGRLIEALRNTGYDNYSAIADLIDNSFDADASDVWVNISATKEEDFCFIISDNGAGMDYQTLDQAMRLGSKTERNIESDLGKFGMGLITASLSIARKLTVITKNNNEYFTSIQDLDEIIKKDRFEKELRVATSKEEIMFDRETRKASSGTVLILEKCDLIQNKNISQLNNKLIKDLSQIFRYFIKSGKNIYIRNNKINLYDPLMMDNKSTEVYSDESFSVENNGVSENVRVKIVLLPQVSEQNDRIEGLNIANQGFYILRNNREVAAGETLGIFTKHNDYNRMRVEISFPGSLDELMGVNFMKKNLKPKQQILDKISQITYPQIVSIRKRVLKERPKVDNDEVDHEKASKVILEKSKLLIRPKINIEKRTHLENHPGSILPIGTDAIRTPKLSREVLADKLNCKFLLAPMGPNNYFFDVDQIGRTTQITYNIDHSYYENFILKNKENQDVINAIDFFVYSLASAKQISSNEDNSAMFDNFFTIFSSNLRTLIN